MVNIWWSVGFFFLSTRIMFAGMYDDNSVMKVPVSASMTKDEKLWQMKEALLNADKQCRPQTQLYNKDGTPELITIMRPDGSVSEIIKGDVGHVSIGTVEKGSVVLHTHPMDSKVNVERKSNSQHYRVSYSQLGPSGADILIAKQTQSTVLALDCASGMILGVDANGNSVEVYFDVGKKTAVIQSLANENRSQQLTIDDLKSMTRDYSQTIADKRLENSRTEVENTSSDRSNNNILHSLADLLETGEDLVEVRGDMREDRRERKAKKQAERERQAELEAERLRQQQLAEQRRKTQSEQKKSDKRSEMKKDEPKIETPKKTEPKQPKPSTTKPKKTTADTIDTSRLDSAAQRQISYLRSLISAGKPATAAQASTYNSYARATVSEINAITAKINSLSVEYEEKRRIAAQVQSKVDRYSSTISSLKSTARANGILK